jgi:hypothetical protein
MERRVQRCQPEDGRRVGRPVALLGATASDKRSTVTEYAAQCEATRHSVSIGPHGSGCQASRKSRIRV